MRLTSTLSTGIISSKSRLTRADRFRRRWLFMPFVRISLPPPVSAKRRLAPLCVFNLGIVDPLSLAKSIPEYSTDRPARAKAEATRSRLARVARLPSRRLGPPAGTRSGGRRRDRGGRPLSRLQPGLDARGRRHHHRHHAPLHQRHALDEPEALQLLGDRFKRLPAELRVRHLPPLE